MTDPRRLDAGWPIPAENYIDQPYVVVLPDGAWLCVLTTGRGHEGQGGQHVVSTRSADSGRTWSEPIDIEPADGPEASWVMPLLVPSGRVYAFYVYNADNLREVQCVDGTSISRVDSLGELMFRYSDDGGRSWSSRRYRVPMREFRCDRDNVYGGKVRFFWGVGKPILDAGVAYVSQSKVHGFGYGFFVGNEGVILRSDNLATEPDPDKIVWETLPDGEVGLRSPGGPVSAENNLVALSDGSLYCTYRTIDGHPCHAYSRDGGHTWTPPAYMTYTPGGRLVKNPRAANFVKKASNGKFLYWFHNHGGTWYDDRNPAWVCGGIERDGQLHWSQPEILLYDDDPRIRMSYPDFVEAEGRYYFTETQKNVGRVHEIDPTLLEGVWRQHELAEVATDRLALDLDAEACRHGGQYPFPELPLLSSIRQSPNLFVDPPLWGGFTLDLALRLDGLAPGQVLVDSRDSTGKGFALSTGPAGTVVLDLHDGRTHNRWDSDPGLLAAGREHHVVAIVDGGPKLILFVIDGQLNDGGPHRQFGWGRFSPWLREVNGAEVLTIAPNLRGALTHLRLYTRALRVSEAVGNWRAER